MGSLHNPRRVTQITISKNSFPNAELGLTGVLETAYSDTCQLKIRGLKSGFRKMHGCFFERLLLGPQWIDNYCIFGLWAINDKGVSR